MRLRRKFSSVNPNEKEDARSDAASVGPAEMSERVRSATVSDGPKGRHPSGRRYSNAPIGRLSTTEKEQLTSLSNTLLSDLLESFETYVYDDDRVVDSSQWKPVKSRDNLYVVKQKARKRSWLGKAAPSDAEPLKLMTTGVVAGRVEDLLYGYLSDSSLEMKMQGSFTNATMHDAAVLAVIEAPTIEDPLHFLGVKWTVHSFGSSSKASTSLLKKRELLYLESFGTTTLSTGETVGYHIQHSVDLKSLIAMTGSTVRATISMCQLFRQKSNNATMEVYMRGYYDPSGGRVSHMMTTSAAVDLMLQGPSKVLAAADLKKLSYSAKHAGRRRRMTTLAMQRGIVMEEENQDEKEVAGCAVCHRDCGGLLHRSGSACLICSKLVCNRCAVSKTLKFAMGPSLRSEVMQQEQRRSGGEEDAPPAPPVEEPEIQKKSLTFCLNCVVASSKQSAVSIAASDLMEKGVTSASDSFHVPRASHSLQRGPAARQRRRATTSTSRTMTMASDSFNAMRLAAVADATGRPKAISSASTATDDSTATTTSSSRSNQESHQDLVLLLPEDLRV
ncbi:hypothetical protein Poli38472_007267 [Pythium oligandrum]|uniref:FYVE-type domain-containing protein n=1 Tax=Pythium oligandrum TaxID=41045 RepID=A0A8K1C9N0_PYTOL|nr:hypothetical protein Poli38472_007267 [Pythium oligandrum]|eukprot:TMW59122.1 hypothetical protein Poli38472_007267 [Pythium oligandrum]